MTSGIAALIVSALAEKTGIHLLLARSDEIEGRAALQCAAMALVVLPIRPQGPFGPWGGVLPLCRGPGERMLELSAARRAGDWSGRARERRQRIQAGC